MFDSLVLHKMDLISQIKHKFRKIIWDGVTSFRYALQHFNEIIQKTGFYSFKYF